MDTITWLRLWLRGASAGRRGTRRFRAVPGRNSRKAISRSTTRSPRCTAWRRALRKSGAPRSRADKSAGVAGSVGKTTTKEILAALVGSRFRVLKTQGNLNNEYGLPLTLLKLSDEHDAAVIELGMSHRGELARLTRIAVAGSGRDHAGRSRAFGVFLFD